MIKKILAVIVILSATAFSSIAYAKVWYVNNTPGLFRHFDGIPAAINSASVTSGDTLYVAGSATSYGGITLNKSLVIIGPGYFLNPADATFPYNTGVQYVTHTAIVDHLYFNNAAANGSKIMGLSILYSSHDAALDDISYIGCYFYGHNYNSLTLRGTNFTIRKCVFRGNITTSGTVSGVRVENNLFIDGYARILFANITGSSSVNIVRNNTSENLISGNHIMANAYVANNIFHDLNHHTFTNTIVKNNLFRINQSLPEAAVGNLVNVDMTTVFEGGTGSRDARLQLSQNSPAIGVGVTINSYTPDCGAFGGLDPYRLSGIPPIPTIYTLTIPAGEMKAVFSTRSNN